MIESEMLLVTNYDDELQEYYAASWHVSDLGDLYITTPTSTVVIPSGVWKRAEGTNGSPLRN